MRAGGINYRYAAKWRLLKALYEPAAHYMQQKLGRIISENNMLHGDGRQYGEILYRGKVYANYDFEDANAFTAESYLIKDELVDRMDDWLRESEELLEEKQEVTRFLSIVLSDLDNHMDTKELLGENLYSIISDDIDHLVGDRMPDSELVDYVRKYRGYSEKMQNRVVDNLLAKALYDT